MKKLVKAGQFVELCQSNSTDHQYLSPTIKETRVAETDEELEELTWPFYYRVTDLETGEED